MVTGNSILEIYAEAPTLTIGFTSNMNVKVTNSGDTPIYSLKLTASSDSLMIVDGETDIGELLSGKSSIYNFPIYVPVTLYEWVYSVSIKADYFDSNGVKQTLSKTIKLAVKSQPTLSLSGYIKDPEIILGDNKEFMVVIKNTVSIRNSSW